MAMSREAEPAPNLSEASTLPESIPHRRADRTQLQQIILGLDDGVLIIDPDQTIAWANKAALDMHGVVDIADLGATIDEYRARFELRYRNNHRLPEGAYPMERIMAGEAFDEVVVEVGPPGEPARWTHRLRSLVLNTPDGRPDCLVLIINDETDRYSAEERFEATFAANPAPAIICRLSDLRYVKVNQGFVDLSGFAREQLLGRLLYDVDVLEAASDRDLAVARLQEGRTIPQMEATLRLADGGSKLVIVAGQPIEVGDDACMLFSFADLEPRRRAEEALKHSEERFSKAFRIAAGPMMVSALEDCRTLDVNDAFIAATGYDRTEAIGRSMAELQLWGDEAAHLRIHDELRNLGHVHSLDVRLRTKHGEVVDYLLSAETGTIQGEPCIISVMQDITARKRSQEELLAAIEAVMQDTSWFGQRIVEKLANLARAGQSRPQVETTDLSQREHEVLTLAAGGLDDVAIAARLGLSRVTIRNHMAAIYAKIGVNRRAAAVIWARERGLDGSGDRRSRQHRRTGPGQKNQPAGSKGPGWRRNDQPFQEVDHRLDVTNTVSQRRSTHSDRGRDSGADRGTSDGNHRSEGSDRRLEGSIKDAFGKVTGNHAATTAKHTEQPTGKADDAARVHQGKGRGTPG